MCQGEKFTWSTLFQQLRFRARTYSVFTSSETPHGKTNIFYMFLAIDTIDSNLLQYHYVYIIITPNKSIDYKFGCKIKHRPQSEVDIYSYVYVVISIAIALSTPHHSARCTNVQSDIGEKQERRLALCYLKFHAYKSFMSMKLKVTVSQSPFLILFYIALYVRTSSTVMRR